MLVQEYMTRNVITASPSTSILVARRLLTAHGIRHLPVVQDDEVIGIVSDRDIRINDKELVASLGALQSDLVTGRYRRLATVMTTPVHVIGPKMKLPIAALFMVSRQIGALPVVDKGTLVGIISLTDCVRALAVEDQMAGGDTHAGTGLRRRLPMPARDGLRGSPAPQRMAVVVDADSAARLQARAALAAAGYDAATCPGPAGGTYCPALRDPDGAPRCPRVPAETELVLITDDKHASALAEAYARWLPDATIRLTPRQPVPG